MKALASFIVNNPSFDIFPNKSQVSTLMHALAASNDVKGIQLILSTLNTEEEKKKAMNLKPRKAVSPLEHAYLYESNDVVQFFKEKGVELDQIHGLVKLGRERPLELVKERIDACKSSEERRELLNCKDADGNTPVRCAAQYGSMDAIKVTLLSPPLRLSFYRSVFNHSSSDRTPNAI